MDASTGTALGIAIIILAGGFLIFLVWWMFTANEYVRLRNVMRESWANVDVALKRRHDLIPNLVRTVERYAEHERTVLEEILDTRQRLNSNVEISDIAREESNLTSLISDVFVLAENYPQLKSDQQFLQLQRELSETEDRIAAARRLYNGNVREYKTFMHSFPSSLLRGNLAEPTFFQIDLNEGRPKSIRFSSAI